MKHNTNMLQKLITAIDEQTPKEGPNETHLNNVFLFRVSEYTEKLPLIYDQCFCIAAQGHKTCHLTDRKFTYSANEFLVAPTVVPVEIEVFPDGNAPLLSMAILIDFPVVQDLMESIQKYDTNALSTLPPSPGLYLDALTDDILEPSLRLLHALRSKTDAEILGKQIVRELHYRLLMSANGHILASAALGESTNALISKALRTIHDNYAAPIDVAHLADAANMSTRAFYNHFKAVTSRSPVQYLKRIRLEKARQFIVNQGEQASTAAHMVGYESPSQFSREFKRHFGYPPREAGQNGQLMAV